MSCDSQQRRERAGEGLSRRGAAARRRRDRDGGTHRAQTSLASVVRAEGGMTFNLLRFMRRPSGSAPVARERLQILLAHERGTRGQSDLLLQLREEILAAVSRHMTIDPDKVQ